MNSFPSIHSQKPSKSISFEFSKGTGKCTGSTAKSRLGESKTLTDDESNIGIHGNKIAKDQTTKSFKKMINHLDKNKQDKSPKTQKGFEGNSKESKMYSEKDNGVAFSHVVQSLHRSLPLECDIDPTLKRTGDVNLQMSKILREKDREISRLREVIRKSSLDRENAACADANSRLRLAELKNKLSNQQRHVEHVTTVERLRCKETVNNETERLRHERDGARVQLEHYEKLVWQLRKQVEQLGYLSRQRYKTIQELGKKMAAKDKSIQEMRKRMEQAQLITIPSTSDRRNSISYSEPKNISWETPSRLTSVKEFSGTST